MISLGGVVELRKSLGMLSPVKLSAVDDNPANGGTVSTNPFGCRVNDDIRAVVKRSAEIPSGTECVVDLHALVLLDLTQMVPESSTYHHRHSLFMCDFDNLLKIGYVIFGVANALNVDGFGLVVDEAGKFLGIISLDELGFDTEPWQKDLELIIGPPIQIRGRDDIIPCVGQGGKGHELGGLARGGGNGGDTSFQRSDTLFEDVDRRLRGEMGLAGSGNPEWKEL